MNTNILGTTPQRYHHMLVRRTILCVAIGGLTLGINLVLTLCRTDSNHTLLLLLNIAVDLLCSFFLIYEIIEGILPRHRLYRLYLSPSEEHCGTLVQIDSSHQRYRGIDCYPVCFDSFRCFLPVGTLTLPVGAPIRVKTVFNIIVEVAQ